MNQQTVISVNLGKSNVKSKDKRELAWSVGFSSLDYRLGEDTRQRTLLAIAIIFLALLSLSVSADNVINVDGDRFQLNGQPYDMWGIRVASASQSQDLNDELIANLDDYKSYGVNTVAVFVQGSSGGFSDPFSYDGKSIDAGHLTQIRQIIEACDDRRMVHVSIARGQNGICPA